MGNLANTAPVTHIAAGVTNRILILDVERVPGITQQSWWDRGDLQKRYIHHESVIREPRTTIVCCKWYDEPEVIRLAEWDRGGRSLFLKRVHKLMSQADIICGHNLDRADVPWLKGDFYLPRIGHEHRPDLPPLPPFKTIDTLKAARGIFGSGAPFKSLDALCKIVGIPSKTDAYDAAAMERAIDGDKDARERLTDYCAGDVIATQWLYDWLRPHVKNHPALFVDGRNKLRTCNRCGGATRDTRRRYVANVMTYSMRKCLTCGAYSRLSIEPERMSLIRGV